MVAEITMPCTSPGTLPRMRGVICPPMLCPKTTLRSPASARMSRAPASATTSNENGSGSGEMP